MISIAQLTPAAEARRWLEMALAEGAPDLETRYWLLWTLGQVVGPQGDIAACHACLQERLAISEARSDRLEMARTLQTMSGTEALVGDPRAALAHARRAVEIARAVRSPGHRRVLGLSLMALGATLKNVRELDHALVEARQSVLVADEIGEPVIRRMTRVALVRIHRARGDLASAHDLLRQAFAIGPAHALGECESLAVMAALLIAMGRPERGIQLVGAIEASCAHFGFDRDMLDEPLGPAINNARGALRARADRLRAAGRRMSLEDAVAFALEVADCPPTSMRLSPREAEVARLVRQGLTDPEIARRLFISKRTAETHVESIR